MSSYISQIRNRVPNSVLWEDFLIYHHTSESYISKDLDKPARIDAYMMILCTKGNIVIEWNQSRYHLSEGFLFLSAPYGIMNASIVDDAEAYVIVMESHKLFEYIGSSLLALKAFEMFYSSPVCNIGKAKSAEIVEAIENLKRYVLAEDTLFKKNIINNYASTILFLLADYVFPCKDEILKPHFTKDGADLFVRFIKVLSENYIQHKEVSFYAEQMCLNSRYLTTAVRKISGFTVSEWIDKFLINDAKYLLNYTDLSVKEVAYKLNFSNISFFCKYFKKHCGQTAMECRKNNLPFK